MRVGADYAVVFDNCTGVDDAVAANARAGVHSGSGEHGAAAAYIGKATHMRVRVDEHRGFKSGAQQLAEALCPDGIVAYGGYCKCEPGAQILKRALGVYPAAEHIAACFVVRDKRGIAKCVQRTLKQRSGMRPAAEYQYTSHKTSPPFYKV
ncbi:hypothetical protein SDC9_165664 [bioreactor metagenome]|uniref:Uncharacterized protein n=1 Tax=bioreactor metagenome TaxID=1076179 RepID=A0A645G2D8_9ZZZZ